MPQYDQSQSCAVVSDQNHGIMFGFIPKDAFNQVNFDKPHQASLSRSFLFSWSIFGLVFLFCSCIRVGFLKQNVVRHCTVCGQLNVNWTIIESKMDKRVCSLSLAAQSLNRTWTEGHWFFLWQFLPIYSKSEKQSGNCWLAGKVLASFQNLLWRWRWLKFNQRFIRPLQSSGLELLTDTVRRFFAALKWHSDCTTCEIQKNIQIRLWNIFSFD